MLVLSHLSVVQEREQQLMLRVQQLEFSYSAAGALNVLRGGPSPIVFSKRGAGAGVECRYAEGWGDSLE